MPWTTKDPPRPAKNWSKPAQALCVRVANAVLKDGKDEQQAIFACIAAVKRKYPGEVKSKNDDGKSVLELAESIYSIDNITFEEEGEGDDKKNTSKLTVAVEGKFVHPWYGEIDLSGKVLSEMRRNFEDGVLGVDIAVDERHDRGRAMGWFKSLSRGKIKIGNKEYSALTAKVEWTAEGRRLLEEKVYKYFSPEFGTFVEPDGKTEHKNVLFGGALTNRPFLKMMPSINLESGKAKAVVTFDDQPGDYQEDWEFEEVLPLTSGLHLDDLERYLEDDGEDEVTLEELIAELNTALSTDIKDKEGLVAVLKSGTTAQTTIDELKTKLKEKGIQFSDTTSVVDVVLATMEANSSQVSALQQQVNDINTRLEDQAAEAAVVALGTKIAPAQREHYKALYKKDTVLFESLTKDLKPVVTLGEKGGVGDNNPAPGTGVEFQDPEKAAEKAKEYVKGIGLKPKSEVNGVS